MPLYEFYCDNCDGVFEALRPMREASDPVPCPVCDRDGKRIMPTSFAAFTFRDGYPRRIPDRGTYWHLGEEVKGPNPGGVPPNEHPELYKPEPKPTPSRGDKAEIEEAEHAHTRAVKRMAESGVKPDMDPQGKPIVPKRLGLG